MLRQGSYLIASIQEGLSDAELLEFEDDLLVKIGDYRTRGVVIDLAGLDVVDSFTARTLQGLAHASQLRGAQVVVAGLRPEVAFTMVQLGLWLDVATALDLDQALRRLEQALART